MSLFYELEERAARRKAVVNGQIPRKARVAPIRKKELSQLIQLARINQNHRFLTAAERGDFSTGFIAAVRKQPAKKTNSRPTVWESQKEHFMGGGANLVAPGSRKSISTLSGGLPTLGKRR